MSGKTKLFKTTYTTDTPSIYHKSQTTEKSIPIYLVRNCQLIMLCWNWILTWSRNNLATTQQEINILQFGNYLVYVAGHTVSRMAGVLAFHKFLWVWLNFWWINMVYDGRFLRGTPVFLSNIPPLFHKSFIIIWCYIVHLLWYIKNNALMVAKRITSFCTSLTRWGHLGKSGKSSVRH